MSPEEYIECLVANYLREKGLTKTYVEFERELNRKFTNSIIDESLVTIIHDRINFNKMRIADDCNEVNKVEQLTQSTLVKSKNIKVPKWNVHYPDTKSSINLHPFSNSLIINSSFWKYPSHNIGLFVTNTKYLIIYSLDSNEILSSSVPLSTQPIKAAVGIDSTPYLFICDMSGTLSVFKLESDWTLVPHCNQELKLHRRLITDFKFCKVKSDKVLGYFASIGWDGRVVFGKVAKANGLIDISIIGDYKLATNPTTLAFVTDKQTGLPVVIVGKLNSTLLSLFVINDTFVTDLCCLSLNDSEFSNHSFQPMNIVEIENDSENSIITIATDHVPYMRLISVIVPSLKEVVDNRTLYPDLNTQELETLSQKLKYISSNQEKVETLHSRVPIVRNLIISNFNSLSPQDKYSNAILLPRSESNGVWIVSDDGNIRGLDINTGVIVETLKNNDGRAKTAFIGSNCAGELLVISSALNKQINLWSS